MKRSPYKILLQADGATDCIPFFLEKEGGKLRRAKCLCLACLLVVCGLFPGVASGFSESENAAFLENSFLAVLQSEHGINASTLLGDETLAAIGASPAFQNWRDKLLADLDAASTMAQTALGPVQYRQEGEGPPVLVFHGGMMGFDNIYLLDQLVEQGFQLIGFSRSGYLRTPARANPGLAQGAHLGAALLDTLGINDPVLVYGTSLGGPSALYFALNHPQRTRALVMQSAVSQTYNPSEPGSDSFLAGFIYADSDLDQRSFMLLEMAKRWPERICFEYLNITNHYCPDVNWQTAQDLMVDADQRERFMMFLTISSPLSLRMPASNQETQLAMELPDLSLEEIGAPVLITQDVMDADVDFLHAQNMINRIPRAELYATRGVGHLYMLGDTWPGVLQRMAEFLNSASQP